MTIKPKTDSDSKKKILYYKKNGHLTQVIPYPVVKYTNT